MTRKPNGWTQAVGKGLLELLLIVAGVLIALLVDEWRGQQQERERVVALLGAVQSNLSADSLYIASQLKRIGEINTALREMSELNPEDLPPNPKLDSLLLASNRYIPDLWTTTAFSGIEQTGDLRLIDDPQLLGALNRYYKERIPRAVEQNSIDHDLNFEFAIKEGFGIYGIERPRGTVAEVLDAENVLAAFGVSREGLTRWLRDRPGYFVAREAGVALVYRTLLNVDDSRAELSEQISRYLAAQGSSRQP